MKTILNSNGARNRRNVSVARRGGRPRAISVFGISNSKLENRIFRNDIFGSGNAVSVAGF